MDEGRSERCPLRVRDGRKAEGRTIGRRKKRGKMEDREIRKRVKERRKREGRIEESQEKRLKEGGNGMKENASVGSNDKAKKGGRLKRSESERRAEGR